MNSLDPWNPIVVDPAGDVIFPRPYYGHPFYRDIPSWTMAPSGETRLVFDGAFISGDLSDADRSRVVSGVHARELQGMFRAFRDQGFTVTGENPRAAQLKTWIVQTHHLLTTLLVTWDAVAGTLRVEITDSDMAPSDVWQWLVPIVFPQMSTIGRTAPPDKLYSEKKPMNDRDFARTNTERRTGLTAEIAPIVAPATGGISVVKELDDKQVLHVKICVDGKCYQSSMDLAPALGLVMNKLARWHQDQHAQMQGPLPGTPPGSMPGATAPAVVGAVVGACDSVVGNATDAIVDELIGHHIECVCGSFLDDIGNAVKGVAGGLASGVSSTIRSLKGPIAAAAGIAATTGAALIPGVGPFVAPIAGKLANDIVNSTIGDNPQAKQAVAQAKQAAQTNPTVALALDQAQKAVANATVAHHVQITAKRAAQGQPQAQQQIVKLAQDAEQGDPAAKAVADLVANAMHSEWGAKLWQQATGRGPSPVSGWYDIAGWYDIVGAGSPLDDVRARGKALATAKRGGAAGGAIHSLLDGHWHTYAFARLDDAIDWLQRVAHDRSSFTYAAAYEKDADGNAYIQGEEIGGERRQAA